MNAKGPIYTPAELLARLVAFDTTSHRSNLELIAFVEDYLLQHGVTSRRIVSDDGEKASLTRRSARNAKAASPYQAIPMSYPSMGRTGRAIHLSCAMPTDATTAAARRT